MTITCMLLSVFCKEHLSACAWLWYRVSTVLFLSSFCKYKPTQLHQEHFFVIKLKALSMDLVSFVTPKYL